MSQTILIEENESLRQLFTINLQTYAATDVIARNSAEETIELLKILPTINLIICRAPVAIKLTSFLEENNSPIPLICLGDEASLKDKHTILKEPILWENVIRTAAKLLGVNMEEVAKRLTPDFMPVSLKYFYEIDQTPCDVYIRIKKSPTEYQYVKRIHSKDTFSIEDIKKYEEQGLQSFYIPKDYEQYFVNFISSKLINKLETDLSVEERLTITAVSYDLVNDQVIRVGLLDQSSLELSNSSISSMIKSVKESPKLNNLLSFLFTSKISYAYQHAHMVTVICHYILSKLEISKPAHLDLLSFISFFSDITLKSRTQIEINSLDDLEQSGLDGEEKLAVTYHARDAAKLMQSHPEAPQGIDKLIIQHHGRLDGVGFEANPPEEIHNLIKIYMVADAFVKFALKPGAFKNKGELIDAIKKNFQSESFAKIIKVLESKIE